MQRSKQAGAEAELSADQRSSSQTLDAETESGAGIQGGLLAAIVLGPVALLAAFLLLLILFFVSRPAPVAIEGVGGVGQPDEVVLGDKDGVAEDEKTVEVSLDESTDSQEEPAVEQDGQSESPASDIALSEDQSEVQAPGQSSGIESPVDEQSEEDSLVVSAGAAGGPSSPSSGQNQADANLGTVGGGSGSGGGAGPPVRNLFAVPLPKPKPPPTQRRISALGENPFMIAAKSESTVFVIDKSGSMDGMAFARVCNTMLDAIAELEPEQEFAVVFFDDSAHPMKNWGLVGANESNLNEVEHFVRSISANGGTNPAPAMELALGLEPELIIVLSDGDFAPVLVDQISNRNRGRNQAEIHTIGLNSNVPTLMALAKRNGGGYKTAK